MMFIAKRFALGLTLMGSIGGCASLDERLQSDDVATRQRAVQKIRSMPISERGPHLDSLVQQLDALLPDHLSPVEWASQDWSYYSNFVSQELQISKTAPVDSGQRTQILTLLNDMGPAAGPIAPKLVQMFPRCQVSGTCTQIKQIILASKGPSAINLLARHASQSAPLLIGQLYRLWNLYGEVQSLSQEELKDSIAQSNRLYAQLLLMIGFMPPQDRAAINIEPILKLEHYRNYRISNGDVWSLAEMDRNVLALLVAIGPPSIPILKRRLDDVWRNRGYKNSDWKGRGWGGRARLNPKDYEGFVNALKQIGTPTSLEVITVWQGERAREEDQEKAAVIKDDKARDEADQAEKVASERVSSGQVKREVLALEPERDFKRVLEMFYDNSRSFQRVPASNYKRSPYKNGVKYSITAAIQRFITADLYIMPTSRNGVFMVRVIPRDMSYNTLRTRLSDDQIVDATPGSSEYIGATSAIDIATGVAQSWAR